jgi:hypothetical protein
VSADARQDALTFLAWSRVWSPLAPAAWRREAWEVLGLPGSFQELETEYWNTFHLGVPAPPVPLLLHAALGRDGGQVREDWMRVFQFLGLRSQGPKLAPDHLGLACEALAAAVENGDVVLVRELLDRYLRPWSRFAEAQLAEDSGALGGLPASFASDLDALGA